MLSAPFFPAYLLIYYGLVVFKSMTLVFTKCCVSAEFSYFNVLDFCVFVAIYPQICIFMYRVVIRNAEQYVAYRPYTWYYILSMFSVLFLKHYIRS